MTQEDKARRYDEALERAKEELSVSHINSDSERQLYRLFPELKESEDEKIIKNLITFLDELFSLGKNTNFDKWSKSDCVEWIAWLEKQGEQKPAVWSEEDERIYNEIIDFFLGDIETRCATIDKQRHFGYWLKSIKPQKHWKPSEEQLRAIINSAQGLYQCKEKEVLLDLYEQLKKL